MTIPTREDLVQFYCSGTLAAEMARRFNLRDDTDISLTRAALASLHNEGVIDLLKLVEDSGLQALGGTSFFMATHFLCDVMPDLQDAGQRVMACVEALVECGGADLAATYPNSAFRKWCSRDSCRAREVIATACTGDLLAGRHLTFALEALGDIPEARRILMEETGALRLSAVTALGRIGDADAASRSQTIRVFARVLDDAADDVLKAHLLHSTAFVMSQGGGADQPEAIELVRRLLIAPGEMVVHQAAHVLWIYPKAREPEFSRLLLEALSHIRPANKGTVEQLDHALSALLESGHCETAVNFVTEVFGAAGELELADLKGFLRHLADGSPEHLGKAVVSWLRDGSMRLCEALAAELWRHRDDQPTLDLHGHLQGLPPPAVLFVCRKALGFLFMRPRSAASVLVSALRACDDEALADAIQDHLQWLLMNYGGVCEYLSQISADDAAKLRVDAALAANKAYLDGLRGVTGLKEFQPSEPQRRIEHLRWADNMRVAQKRAESQSVLFGLVKRSVLLYGSRSLSFIGSDGDKLRPMEMDLKSFSTSFELPRMEVVDPVGLDYTLRVYRVERMVQ